MTPRGHRTPEQIREQVEARYAEMEREINSPAMQFPCKSCRWAAYGPGYHDCIHPLVMGIKHVRARAMDDWVRPDATLCGIEKALWEPKLSIWQRIVDWFLQPWRDDIAQSNGKG